MKKLMRPLVNSGASLAITLCALSTGGVAQAQDAQNISLATSVDDGAEAVLGVIFVAG